MSADKAGRVPSTKCIGIWGRLFGHKFKYSNMEWERYTDFCTRCGMPKGGWPR